MFLFFFCLFFSPFKSINCYYLAVSFGQQQYAQIANYFGVACEESQLLLWSYSLTNMCVNSALDASVNGSVKYTTNTSAIIVTNYTDGECRYIFLLFI
jgi:hypothetical protein